MVSRSGPRNRPQSHKNYSSFTPCTQGRDFALCIKEYLAECKLIHLSSCKKPYKDFTNAPFLTLHSAYIIESAVRVCKIRKNLKERINEMKKTLSIILVFLLALGMLSACGAEKPAEKPAEAPKAAEEPKELSGTVATDGSTSMEKLIGALGESFMNLNKGVTFTYNPTGSGSGITAVKEGRCDIGLSSRALKDEEKKDGLKGTVLALDGIAIIVSPDNKVEDLSLEQIAGIYTGEIKNWKEVGGADAEIVVIGREAGSGTRDGFESITGTKDKCAYRQELTSTGDVITTVAGNPDAIGYASLASVKDTVKALKVDGVVPSDDTVKDGSYKVQRPFVLVTVEGKELSEVAQAFFDYITSGDVAEIFKKAGVVPAA